MIGTVDPQNQEYIFIEDKENVQIS